MSTRNQWHPGKDKVHGESRCGDRGGCQRHSAVKRLGGDECGYSFGQDAQTSSCALLVTPFSQAPAPCTVQRNAQTPIQPPRLHFRLHFPQFAHQRESQQLRTASNIEQQLTHYARYRKALSEQSPRTCQRALDVHLALFLMLT